MLLTALYLFWLLLNARVTPEILLLGLPVTAAVVFLCARVTGYSLRKDLRLLRRLPAVLAFSARLLGEVLRAALRVARLIWTPGTPVSAVAEVRPPLKTRAARVLLADAITLTPGTITLELEDGTLLVHCLEKASGEDLASGSLARRVRALEEKML